MTVAAQLEVLDLRHFSGRQMRPLLQQEAAAWKTRLRWDYGSSIELLLDYVEAGTLPGFVALSHGEVCGYTFCVYEGRKAVIGDLYASSPSSLPVMQTLLCHLLEMLQHSPGTDRIESQLLLLRGAEITPVFARAGFSVFPRLFMEWELPHYATRKLQPVWPHGIQVLQWSPAHYEPAAELIQSAYVGHIDARINDQYETLAGSLRFLHNIISFPGCGAFEPGSSWVLQDRKKAMVGVVLCSRVASGVAHITQLCISRELRQQGLGKMLLQHCMEHLAETGLASVTLTVTQGNEPAVRNYERLGYVVRHHFDATLWTRADRQT